VRPLNSTCLASSVLPSLGSGSSADKNKRPTLCQQLLGQKSADRTTFYIQLDQALSSDKPNEIYVGTIRLLKKSKRCLRLALDTSVREKAYRSSGNVCEQLICDCLL
jgi:hypothetical protein